jgi:hypothetical protein
MLPFHWTVCGAFGRERVLPLGRGVDLRHHVWPVDQHPLQGRRPGLAPLRRN